MIPLNTATIDTGLEDWGIAEDVGYETIGETSKVAGRVDYGELAGSIAAGVFKATRGKFRVTYGFAEHVCVHRGEVHLTDEAGATHVMKQGDAWFIAKGETVLWDIKSEDMIKSFLITPAQND